MKAMRFLAGALALLMLLFAIGCGKEEEQPIAPPSEDKGDVGTANPPFISEQIAGTALTWELYRDGTLKIKGEGAMGEELFEKVELGHNEQPWQKYARVGSEEGVVIKKVIVENGVSELSQKCFKDCVYLELVQLPESVTVIPMDCFNGCTALKQVFATGVVTVKDNAFQTCKLLQRVTLSAELSEVLQGAFHQAGTESSRFEIRVAGTEEVWQQSLGTLVVEDAEYSNKLFFDALESASVVIK